MDAEQSFKMKYMNISVHLIKKIQMNPSVKEHVFWSVASEFWSDF